MTISRNTTPGTKVASKSGMFWHPAVPVPIRMLDPKQVYVVSEMTANVDGEVYAKLEGFGQGLMFERAGLRYVELPKWMTDLLTVEPLKQLEYKPLETPVKI